MTLAAYGNLPAGFRSPKPAGFTSTNGTVAKVLVEQIPAALAQGSLPPYYGGGTLIDMTATSTDSVSRDILLYVGTVQTTQDATATGAITTGGQNTLTRGSGNWIADDWEVGAQAMVFTAKGTSQVVTGIDGIPLIVTAVTATVLTFSGTPLAAGANILTAGSRIVAVANKACITIPANSGNSSTIPNTLLLGNTDFDKSKVTTELKFGPNNLIIGAMQAALTAAAQVNVLPSIATY